MSSIDINYNGEIEIAVGKSRREVNWVNKRISWQQFLNRVSKTTYTAETRDEFMALSKGEQNVIKDVGGFVGGFLINGKRKNGGVKSRSLITLDADNAFKHFWFVIKEKFNFACCIYSTHKHTENMPRYRVVIPLSHSVGCDEYEAISRKLAEIIGLHYFDNSTHEAARLMYWPSTSSDGDFVFQYIDEPFLKPETILSLYEEWENIESWPREKPFLDNSIKGEKKSKQVKQSPKDKEGLVGAFCKAYPIHKAIEKFLMDIYKPAKEENRYTYVNGTSYGGLVVYEKGDFAYSHHSTDPAGGKLLNSFDLVRIHLFGESEGNSFNNMVQFIKEDFEVKLKFAENNINSILEDFEESDKEWAVELTLNGNGEYATTTKNIMLILENDINLKGAIALNDFSQRIYAVKNLPWRSLKNKEVGDYWEDADDCAIRDYLESNYKIWTIQKVSDCINLIAKQNKFNPVINYLNSINWDGSSRLESLFIDYLGAEDSEYIRTVTRKAFTAAVARIFEPGIKYDYMPVLIGEQGIGKSYILDKLGGGWFSDSLTTVSGKEAYEQLQECWIIELAELAAFKGICEETIKNFLSKREDIYRFAYGKRTVKYPRQCVFFGTTNNREFLSDRTGNRRFWPIETNAKEIRKNLWKELTAEEVNQIWAEAVNFYKNGEELFLSKALELEVKKQQAKHIEEDYKEGLIRDYLDMPLPKEWYSYSIEDRRRYIHGSEFGVSRKGMEKRTKVCTLEIIKELFLGDILRVDKALNREINEILRGIEGWERYSGQLRFGQGYGKQRAFVRS